MNDPWIPWMSKAFHLLGQGRGLVSVNMRTDDVLGVDVDHDVRVVVAASALKASLVMSQEWTCPCRVETTSSTTPAGGGPVDGAS